jgi:hypothetical protein
LDNVLATQTLKIASIVSGVTVEVESVVASIGFSNVMLNTITIKENVVGGFTHGGTLRFELDQFGWAQMIFGSTGPVAATARLVNVTGGGNRVVGATLTHSSPVGDYLDLTVSVAGQANANSTPATITISGITVVSPLGNVPAGLYNLTVSGSIITNLDAAVLNETLRPGHANFRTWAQGPMVVENVINVGNVGPGGEPLEVNAVLSMDHGRPGFTLDGNQVLFRNAAGVALTSINREDRVFVPMRSVIEAFGGEAHFLEGENGAPHRILTILPGAPREEVIWTVGSRVVEILGGSVRPITSAPYIVNDSSANNGSTFIPIRGIHEAHGVGLDVNDAARSVTLTLSK